MGLVLNSGREETGAYVAEIVAGGNAEADGTLRVGDVLITCGPDGFDVPSAAFDDVMGELGKDPDAKKMKVTVNRYAAMDGPNKTKPEGYIWLEGNRKREGVVSLPSGLQYKVLRKGTGTRVIKTDTACACHYSGTLLDGKEFDSSYKRGNPSTFAPRQVIKGWTEAMQLMVEGDKWELYLPAELGYGGRGSPSGSIKPGDALVFTIEICEIKG
jgi:FKBP-type peptidyl-prolyl cis-trans isomerase FklB